MNCDIKDNASHERNNIIQNEKLFFYTSRKDGLGARLVPFIFACVLAKKLNGVFKFDWADIGIMNLPDVSINSAQNTFTEEYLTQHHVQDVRKESDKMSFLTVQGLLDPNFKLNNHSLLDFYPETKHIPDLISQVIEPTDPSKIFEQIGFLPKLIQAYKRGREAGANRRFAALHIRSGDIVYGPHRFFGVFAEKATPFPLAYLINQREIEKGFEVIVFGEEKAFSQTLQDDFSSLHASDLMGNITGSDEQAFFDIGLMSQASSIYSAESSFSVIAAILGKTEIINPYNIIPKDNAIEITEKLYQNKVKFNDSDLAKDAKQRAFWMYALYSNYKEEMSYQQRIQCLAMADHAEPSNKIYNLISIFESLENGGNSLNLVELLEDESQMKIRGSIWEILSYRYFSKYADRFAQQAIIKKDPFLAICAAYHYQRNGKPDDAQKCGLIFLSKRPDSLAWLDKIANEQVL